MARSKKPAPRPEVLAFLADAKEHPDDDTPRLVLADWLDEHGGDDDRARAELLRGQCRLARLSTEHPQWEALYSQSEAILRERGPRWKRALGAAGNHASFVRGLVHLVIYGYHLEKTVVARVAPEEVAWIEHATLYVGGINVSLARAIANSPLFGHLASLNLANVWGWGRTNKWVEILAGAPFMSRLRRLELSHTGREQLTALLSSARLGGLQTLNLNGFQRGLDATEVLGGCEALAGVPALELVNIPLDPQALEPLAGSPFLRSLKTLRLHRVRLKNDGLDTLADAPILDHLTTLDLAENAVGAGGIQALRDSPRSGRLTTLVLVKNKVGPEAVRALGHSPHLGNLESLDLRHNPLGPGGARALAEGDWPNLRHLNLAFTELQSEGAQALAASPGLRSLRTLHLESNHLDDGAVRALVRSRQLRDLEVLTVYDEDISEAGYRMVQERFGEGHRE